MEPAQAVNPVASFSDPCKTVTVNAGSTVQVLQTDPSRLVMLLSSVTTGANAICRLGDESSTAYSFLLVAGTPVEITYQKHGDIVFRPLYVTAQATQISVGCAVLRKL